MHNVIENVQDTLRSGELGAIICPVCDRFAPTELFAIAALPEGLQSIITANAAATTATEVCCRCVELFNRAQRQIESHSLVFEQNDFVLPTPLRMDADERFTGRGVTAAFLDSGFYAHPDLTQPTNRIRAYHSIIGNDKTTLDEPSVASWHGMMTSVVAAGNGTLSQGFYRGIASDAQVVLVKLAKSGRISEQKIRRGLEWVLQNRDEYGIRIVNISAGGDEQSSYLDNALCRT